MPSVFEISPSGRAKCRGCEKLIAKGELRFGEQMENPYGDGMMSLWFHPLCGALKRPEPFLEALDEPAEVASNDASESTPAEVVSGKLDREKLRAVAEEGIAHPKLQRLSGIERAASGRARCRSCKVLIDGGSWRLKLVFYQDGRFEPSGYVHVACSAEYLECGDLLPRLRSLTVLSESEEKEIARALEG